MLVGQLPAVEEEVQKESRMAVVEAVRAVQIQVQAELELVMRAAEAQVQMACAKMEVV